MPLAPAHPHLPPQPPPAPPQPTRRQPLLVVAALLLPSLVVALLGIARLTSRPHPTTAPVTASPYAKLVGRPGFWRLARTPAGVWWFLSPDLHRDFLNSVTTVWPYQKPFDTSEAAEGAGGAGAGGGGRGGGGGFLSKDYDGGYTDSGDLRRWATATIARIHSAGFKSLGAWCHPIFHDTDIPITRDLNLWKYAARSNGEFIRIYDHDFFPAIEAAVKTQVIPLRDNHSLIGYYTDNELDWGDDHLGPWRYFDNLPPTDPSRRVVTRLIHELWPTAAAFNADWGTKLTNWDTQKADDLDALEYIPRDKPRAYLRLQSALLSDIARTYFRQTTDLVHKYDPNHLILGVRFRGYAVPEVLAAAKGITDAQSLNYYVSDALLDEQMTRDALMLAAQPLIITEYSFHSLDNRSKSPNKVGFAGQVTDQKARADAYRLMTERLARIPWVVGADWFQWNDEPPSGRSGDGEDVNFGVVDIHDRPYERLVDQIRETSARLNDLHAASDITRLDDIFRQSPAKPTFVVPYLHNAPTLGDPLTAWPTTAQLPGVRHSMTVGLERSPVPLPLLYLGWREEGLYLAMEVFDTDIEAVAATGNWWTRDCAEWWIATAAPTPGQHFYDASCRQFFFTPDHAGAPDAPLGTVGLWHRPGDGLPGPVIPAQVKSFSQKLPDRYRLQVFIPAAALTDYNPAVGRELAFNLNVRNFRQGLEYFWSAGKESQTQLRPDTWGRLILGQ